MFSPKIPAIPSKPSTTNIQTPFTYYLSKHRQRFVSIILTESIASSLNVKAHHLQDIPENGSKSKICVLVESERKGPKEDGEDGRLPISDNVALFRVVPMEDSSTSVFEMDDLSRSNSSEKQQKEQSKSGSLYLLPQFVDTNSLMAVCSIAHEGNLFAELDKIFVNIRDSDIPLSSSSWVNMCRICHGSDSTEELIGPCHCKGSVALAHLSCLERWLRESSRSNCELCLHHYEIQREPKYNFLKSILVWLSTPGEHRGVLIDDFLSFCLYTPSAIITTYLIMLVGETAAKKYDVQEYNSGHFIMFCAIVGIAAIDFTYSSWFMMRLQTHLENFKTWYRENCCLTLLLPPRKRRRRCANVPQHPTENEVD